MIKAIDLTKNFGSLTAVNKVNFEIDSGDIVGFLGVNGAGKSTTMRMINGYLSPSIGQILIDGHCTYKESLKARSKIGYMAENNPLPQELRVKEYLKFRATLKKVPIKRTNQEVDRVIEACLIRDVQKSVIGTLSKGYRQRVALADALLNDPPILLLDEPTVGLDPNQIKHIRKLIKNIGAEKTIMISTHIMQEVESICTKIIFMHQGKVVINEPLAKLKKELGQSNSIKVITKCSDANLKEKIENLPGINGFFEHTENDTIHYKIDTDGNESTQIALFQLFVQCNSTLIEFKKEQSNLEDIFLKVTSSNLPSNEGAKA